MSKVLKRRWRSTLGGSGLPRKDIRPCDYEAYVPDPLVGRRITLDGEVAADVADAEAAIARLNSQAAARSSIPRRSLASCSGPRLSPPRG